MIAAEQHDQDTKGDRMSGRADSADAGEARVSRFQIFRAADAQNMEEHMPTEGLTDVDLAGVAHATAEGAAEGGFARLLFADPVSGMSVGYVWFKPNFVLPRHSHNADCTYYVISGEARLGTEVLRPGDGFFVPAAHNYQYAAGPEGVEVLEVRKAPEFNIRLSGNGEAAWRRFAETAAANRQRWREILPPPAAAAMGA
jgi:quercetin dioxygenase-like cupin family protein